MAVVVGLVAALAAGCSDGGGGDGGGLGGVDGASLVAPFGERAEAAYEAADMDRTEDFTRGVTLDEGCFVITDDGAAAVAEALGVDGVEVNDDGSYISGPPDHRESLVCSLDPGGDGPTIGIGAGTLPFGADELFDEFEVFAAQNDEEVDVLEGDAAGLGDDNVVAVGRDDRATYSWVDGGFVVHLTVPDQMAGADSGFEALPVLVDAVAAALGGD